MGRKKIKIVILIISIALIVAAVYLYYQQDVSGNKEQQTAFNTTTESNNTTEIQEATIEEANTTENEIITEKKTQEASNTTEKKQNKKLPDNYEWDEKRWGEPPQIIYDFAENQEKFDLIVSEVDSILSGEDGFSTWMENGKIHYYSEYGNQLSSELKNDFDYLMNNTKFYEFTKYESDYWYIYYNQENDMQKYIYAMIYDPKMTNEELEEMEYIKVVDKWYFHKVWKY